MSAVQDTATPIFDMLVAEVGLGWPVADDGGTEKRPPAEPDTTVDRHKECRGTPQHFGETSG